MKIEFEIDVLNNIEDLEDRYAKLVRIAKEAAMGAYAPYSNFFVGAAVLMDNGEYISGSNQENGAFPSGNCAERSAISAAYSSHPKNSIVAIAIVGTNDGEKWLECPPCGNCRQLLSECELRQNRAFDIILYSSKDIKLLDSIEPLLPLRFNLDQ